MAVFFTFTGGTSQAGMLAFRFGAARDPEEHEICCFGSREQLGVEQKHKVMYNYVKYEITFVEANCPVLGQNARRRFYEFF